MSKPLSSTKKDAPYLEGLNTQQREAVLAPPGPSLVLAGAGSGKTRVIVHRILHLLESGTPPSAILALTFTNKAAGEMRERLTSALGPSARGVWLGTFHATGARILRAEWDRLNLPRNFVVMSRGECLTIVKREMTQAGISTERYPPRTVLERIGRFKTSQEPPDPHAFTHSLETVAAKMAPRYEKTLRSGGGLDFDDLLALPLRLFRDHPDVLDQYRARFAEILVDEFQDTNVVQNRLVVLLAGDRKRIFAVGDDDQSIYRWRGAEVENIRRFEREFPGARIFRLEENYRSSAKILAAAGEVMKRARGRHEKSLFTSNPPGEDVVYFSAADPQVEAQMICQRLVKAGAGESIPWNEVAIFYRTNTQSRPFEEEARRRGIPYQVVKGQRFFDRAEVQDLAAYLRLANRPDDAPALTRIINRPNRGLGPSKVLAIQGGDEDGMITIDAARRALQSGVISGIAARSLGELISTIEDLSDKRLGPARMLEMIIERTGYRQWLQDIVSKSTSPERRRAAERGLEGTEEFIVAAYAFEERLREEEGMSGDDPDALTRFLEDLALASETDEMEDGEGKLSLMTLHAAKGLEFRLVAVAGVQDGLIPHSRSFNEPESLEEERRLLYVGMTRAKERLFLAWARERRPDYGSGGGWDASPSRFLDLIPDDVLVREESSAAEAGFRRSLREESPGIFSAPRREARRSKGEQKVSKVPDKALGPFSPGARVIHPKFGKGIVTARSGTGERAIVTVNFEQVGSKKLVLQFAPLKPVDSTVDGGETRAV